MELSKADTCFSTCATGTPEAKSETTRLVKLKPSSRGTHKGNPANSFTLKREPKKLDRFSMAKHGSTQFREQTQYNRSKVTNTHTSNNPENPQIESSKTETQKCFRIESSKQNQIQQSKSTTRFVCV